MAELFVPGPPSETPPFPLDKVAVAMLVNLGNTASYLVSLPFVAFMVLRYYPNLAVNEVGYLSGLLEGAFHVGAVFGACIWAAFSERFGRRPAVLFGLAGSCVAALAFGFSPTFPVAMAARFMWGLLNGNIGVVKTMISDVCPDEHSARAFSFLGVAAGLGRVIGPAVGGLLSEPATKYPSVFGASTLLQAYPYALPCSVGALLSFGTLIVAAVVLEETRGLALAEQRTIEARIDAAVKARVKNDDPSDVDVTDAPQLQSDATSLAEAATKEVRDSDHAPTSDAADRRGRPKTLAPSDTAAVSVEIASPAAAASSRDNQLSTDDEDEDDERVGFVSERVPASAPRNGCPANIGVINAGAVELTRISMPASKRPVQPLLVGDTPSIGEDRPLPSLPALPELSSPVTTSGSARRGRRGILCCSCSCARTCRLLRDPPVLVTTALYTGLGGTAIVSNEVTSLQLMNAPEFGGLSWQSTEIGILNAVAGPALILFQACVYDGLVRRLGLLQLLRWSLALQTAFFVASPFVSLLSHVSPSVQWAVVTPVFVVATVARVSSFTCVFVTVANAALPADRSAVNGLGQAAVSAARAVLPPLGTALFALSVRYPDTPWPANWHAVWLGLAAATLGLFGLSAALPAWIVGKRVAAANAG